MVLSSALLLIRVLRLHLLKLSHQSFKGGFRLGFASRCALDNLDGVAHALLIHQKIDQPKHRLGMRRSQIRGQAKNLFCLSAMLSRRQEPGGSLFPPSTRRPVAAL